MEKIDLNDAPRAKLAEFHRRPRYGYTPKGSLEHVLQPKPGHRDKPRKLRNVAGAIRDLVRNIAALSDASDDDVFDAEGEQDGLP